MNVIASFFRDESGATAAEYALIVAVIGAGIVVALGTLGGNISTGLTNAGTHITSGK